MAPTTSDNLAPLHDALLELSLPIEPKKPRIPWLETVVGLLACAVALAVLFSMYPD
jgi:hypothetical protein